MTEQTQQATTQAGAAPARVEIEDFIEAVTRGVARALEAEDDVSGYLLERPASGLIAAGGTITIGIVYIPPDRLGSGPIQPVPPSQMIEKAR